MHIFIYGTLRHLPLLEIVAGAALANVPAALDGHRVVRQRGGLLPCLIRQAGASCDGILVEVDGEAKRRLDAYELPYGYTLEPVSVQAGGAAVEAMAYFPDAGIATSDEVFSLDAWAAVHLKVTLEYAREFDLAVDQLGEADIATSTQMMWRRAEARVRAAETPAPGAVRYNAGSEDFGFDGPERLWGRFFRMSQFDVRHRRFDGVDSGPLAREVLVGSDAALVLPYDPNAGTVLLVEQFRNGPFRRGDPNPWCLEPVAGIMDPGETPEQTARREAEEEAGLKLDALEQMFAVYSSPGNATDHFYCFAAAARLDGVQRFGGLADENEDLRLHVVTLDAALDMIGTGEINVGPLVSMLYWLDRNRARLGIAA